MLLSRLFLFWILVISLGCQSDEPILNIVNSNHELLNEVFDDVDKYELQIRYTQIARNADNTPIFTTINFNYDSLRYFYPASTVKMPVAFLALERLNEIDYVDRNTTVVHLKNRKPQSPSRVDSTSLNYLPSIAHYVNKLFVVSDNDAYNRLYEFLGQDWINERLQKKGIFTESRIVTRVGVSGFSTEENKYTNTVQFLDQQGEVIHEQKAQKAEKDHLNEIENTLKGKGYYSDRKRMTIEEPFDMSEKNFVNLRDLEAALKRVVFPKAFSKKERYKLTPDQYDFLYKSMLRLPKDYAYLSKDTTELYYDSYGKFFLFGDKKDTIPDHIKIMNKVGYAYGYLTDCAYIFDTNTGVEFFLTATVHVNENQIYNDGVYEYNDVGIPFLAELGRQIYQYELQKNRENVSSFNQFLNLN